MIPIDHNETRRDLFTKILADSLDASVDIGRVNALPGREAIVIRQLFGANLRQVRMDTKLRIDSLKGLFGINPEDVLPVEKGLEVPSSLRRSSLGELFYDYIAQLDH